MLSAVGQVKITKQAISLGAEYYIVKPFEIELLIKRIRDIKYYKPTTSTSQNSFASREININFVAKYNPSLSIV